MWLSVNVSLFQKKVAKIKSVFSQLNEVNAILREPHVGSFCSLILFSWIIWARWSSKSFSFKDKAARNTWSNTNKHTSECSTEWGFSSRSIGLEWRIWSILMFSSDKKVLKQPEIIATLTLLLEDFREYSTRQATTTSLQKWCTTIQMNNSAQKLTTNVLNDSLTVLP